MQLVLPGVVRKRKLPLVSCQGCLEAVQAEEIDESSQFVFNAIVEFEIQREIERWKKEQEEWDHPQLRAYERYGIVLESVDRQDIFDQIEDDWALFVSKDNHSKTTRKKYVVRCQGRICMVVVAVHSKRYDLVTFLPLKNRWKNKFKKWEKRKKEKDKILFAFDDFETQDNVAH